MVICVFAEGSGYLWLSGMELKPAFEMVTLVPEIGRDI